MYLSGDSWIVSNQWLLKSLLNFKYISRILLFFSFLAFWHHLRICYSKTPCIPAGLSVRWSEEAEHKLCRLYPSAAWWMTWCLSKSQVIVPQRTHLKYLNIVEHEQFGHQISKTAVVKRLCGWNGSLTAILTPCKHRWGTETYKNRFQHFLWLQKTKQGSKEGIKCAMFSQICLVLLS